jgi:ribonuclease P protein component
LKTEGAKVETLRGYRSFSRVISEGRQISVGGLKAFFVAEPSVMPTFQVGFAVTKRLRKAAERNRVKRMMREATRNIRDQILQVVVEKEVTIRAVFLFLGVAEAKIRRIPARDFDSWMHEAARMMTGHLTRNTQ